jgi:membrane protein insertase Oxa1/YidC/SpoIIIJ
MNGVLILIIIAVFVRLLILRFTLKTDKYFSAMSSLYITLDKRIKTIALKFMEDPKNAYVEEISAIDCILNQIQKYKNPSLFIIPIVLQAMICTLLYLTRYWNSGWHVDFLWFRDLSAKDPYYLLSPILMISLIVRHQIFVPHKMKFVMGIPVLLLLFLSLNWAAAFNIFAICLIVLSTVQSSIVRWRYKSPSFAVLLTKPAAKTDSGIVEPISDLDNKNNAIAESFDFREWVHHFKKKTSLFLYDEVLMSIILGLGGIGIFILYWAYFYWRQKREWRSELRLPLSK